MPRVVRPKSSLDEAAAKIERSRRIAGNRDRVEKYLLDLLAKDIRAIEGQGDFDVAGWSVKFDLERVSGDPEGEQRGQRVNSRDKSIKFHAPDGQLFKGREAAVAFFTPEEESEEEEEITPPALVGAPVQTEEGELAFEVGRILDVRINPDTGRGNEFLVRWVGYSSEDDSWEPEEGFLDREPIEIFEAKRARPVRPSTLKRQSRPSPSRTWSKRLPPRSKLPGPFRKTVPRSAFGIAPVISSIS